MHFCMNKNIDMMCKSMFAAVLAHVGVDAMAESQGLGRTFREEKIAQVAESGGWISGGGDPVRLRFAEGKQLAEQIVTRIDVSGLSSNNDVERWILKNRDKVVAELQKSPLIWTDQDRWNCAITQHRAGATIELSLPACASHTRDRDEAARLLVHEVVHHLGVTDESFADSLAIRFFQLWESQLKLPWCFDSERRHGIVSGRLSGHWIVDEPLATRLGFSVDHYGLREIAITDDPAQLEKFPGLGDRCAYMAGRIRMVTTTGEIMDHPFALVQLGGNPHLVFIEGFRSDGTPDFESFHLMMGIAESGPLHDILFVGDDHPEPLMPFRHP